MLSSAAFLPLTLSVTDGLATARRRSPAGARAVSDAARRVELDASATWAGLLGDYSCPARAELPEAVRLLSQAVGRFAGPEWWDDAGRAHRDRAGGYLQWLEESLAEDDGAGFASAFAGYDEAIARALTTAAPRRSAGRRGAVPPGSGQPGHSTVRRSGTMAGWVQATTAPTEIAELTTEPSGRGRSRTGRTVPHRATNRPATSSSRSSRRSRSAG